MVKIAMMAIMTTAAGTMTMIVVYYLIDDTNQRLEEIGVGYGDTVTAVRFAIDVRVKRTVSLLFSSSS